MQCDYQATLDTYGQTRYYLDAAAWAALGDTARATYLLSERLASGSLSPLMGGLMSSLLAVLEGRHADARTEISSVPIGRDPEVLLYLARHLGKIGAAAECIRVLRRARIKGLTSSYTLEHDTWFAPVRGHGEFVNEVEEAKHVERATKRELASRWEAPWRRSLGAPVRVRGERRDERASSVQRR